MWPRHRGRAVFGPAARAHHALELFRAPHPRLLRQHDPSWESQGAKSWPLAATQTESCSRPLRRRAASTARPARLRIRSRKPWTLARRRLFGWNVRLLTGTPGRFESFDASMKGGHVMRRAAGTRPVGHADAADVAWVSLLTVRVILAQVKLSFSGLSTRQHHDFHNLPAAGDLGCGKIKVRRSPSAGRPAAA